VRIESGAKTARVPSRRFGWDGRVRSAAERRPVSRDWPAALEPLSDSYVDQVFQGPFG